MLWLILVALAIAGGHWLEALLYGALALCSQPKHRPQVVIVRTTHANEPPGSPYDLAVARQQARRFQLVKGDIR